VHRGMVWLMRQDPRWLVDVLVQRNFVPPDRIIELLPTEIWPVGEENRFRELRAVLRAGLVVLLVLPLTWLAWFILDAPGQPPSPDEAKIGPMLTHEQRTSLRTYHRRCRTGADCEPPLGCLYDLRFLNRYCSDSECMTDRQCPEGHVCRVLTTFKGPWLRQCVALGDRAEGERCYALPPHQEDACRPGLLCAGDGWCGRPCRTDEPASCPEGFFCADLEPAPACLPACETRGCPAGQECMRSRQDGASVCAVVHGHNCQRAPCPQGDWCEAYLVPKRPGEAWVRCVQRCGKPGSPPCPSGQVCHLGSCERVCSPDSPGACGGGFHCIEMPEGGPRVCKPEWYRPRD
jgi:hypothetical protein